METQPAEALTRDFSKKLEDFEPAPTQTDKFQTQKSEVEELKVEDVPE
jgi:hypothetical protein